MDNFGSYSSNFPVFRIWDWIKNVFQAYMPRVGKSFLLLFSHTYQIYTDVISLCLKYRKPSVYLLEGKVHIVRLCPKCCRLMKTYSQTVDLATLVIITVCVFCIFSLFHLQRDESQSKKAFDFSEIGSVHTIDFGILISLLRNNQPISS